VTASDRAPAAGDTTARRVGAVIAGLVVREFPRRFGLLEVFALGSVEWMRRHLAIVNAMEALRRTVGRDQLRVLDFGGANGALGRALRFYGLEDAYRLVLVDIDRDAIESAPVRAPVEAKVVIEPSGVLPFPDGAFDLVVSSDVFEHIPASARPHWSRELARVARLGQIHSVPADSDDGTWISTDVDRQYDAWFHERFGTRDLWTSEHLTTGVPTIQSLKDLFDGRIEGISNARAWLLSMQAQQGSKSLAARIRFALRYYRSLRSLEGRPPFKNCLVVVGPNGTSSPEEPERDPASVDDGEQGHPDDAR
jgi:SAM-dependent methyltransferase